MHRLIANAGKKLFKVYSLVMIVPIKWACLAEGYHAPASVDGLNSRSNDLIQAAG